MKYAILILSLFFLCTTAQGTDDVEFGDWYGVRDAIGNKYVATFSGEKGTELRVYIDDQNMHRLKFDPEREISVAKFVKRGGAYRYYPSMNFKSLYGYDHWIRKMKRDYYLHVWFKGDKRYEVFSLKGFYKAERWLFK